MNVPITPQPLPSGFCPTDLQTMWNGFAAAGYVVISDAIAQTVWQQTKPTDSTLTWGQVDALGRPVRIYRFAQGAWLSLHTLVPGLTMWWFDTLPTFTTFDGGDANALGDASGPMWRQALDSNGNLIAARFAIAAGTLPSGTVLQLGNTGGEENHTLTPGEAGVSPTHRHGIGKVGNSNRQIAVESGGSLSANQAGIRVGGSGDIPSGTETDVDSFGDSVFQTDVPTSPPTLVPHNNMPPYVVGYLIQRTARLFYAVP